MRILKFTTRRLMTLVGIAAAVLWVTRLVVDRQQYLELADAHDMTAQLYRGEIKCCFILGTDEEMQILADYHTRLKRKYEQAASHPWFPVEPDPPEPQRIPSGASDGS